MEGIRISSALQGLFGGHGDLLAGKAIGTAKPSHALFLALGYLLFGVHDYTAAGVSAAASVASVGAVFLIGRRLFNPPVGVFAALLLATSEYDIIYARSALSESDGTLLFLLAVCVWLWGSVKTTNRQVSYRAAGASVPLGAGLLLGLAFTTNYRELVYAVLLVAVDLILAYRQKPTRALARALIWGAALLIPLVIWQCVDLLTHSHGLLLFANELKGGWRPYFSQVVYQLHEGKQSSLRFQPLPYLQWFALRQGWWQLGLLILGLAVAASRRSLAWMVTLTFVLLPYVVYVFAPFTVPRSLVSALPFVFIAIAAGIWELATYLWAFLARRQWTRSDVSAHSYARFVSVLVVALVLGGIAADMSWRLTAERSGFVAAARYVEKHNRGRALTSSEIEVFYLRGSGPSCDAPALPRRTSQLSAYVAQGYGLAILERHHSSPVAHFVRTQALRVAHFRAVGPLNIGEDPISSENSDPLPNTRPTEYVDVFKFVNLAKPVRETVHIKCSRDRVT